MPIPFQLDANRNPATDALLLNALIIQQLYTGGVGGLQEIARQANITYIGSRINHATFAVDYAIFRDGTDALVCFDGTTNFAQWSSYIGAGILPVHDYVIDTEVFNAFYVSEQIIEDEVFAVLRARPIRRLVCSGHSLGSAAAHIFARHFKKYNSNVRVELTTFGEPKAYVASTGGLFAPEVHSRIIAAELEQDTTVRRPQQAITGIRGSIGGSGIGRGALNPRGFNLDPVTIIPPNQAEFVGLNAPLRTLGRLGMTGAAVVAGITWQHYGVSYFLTRNALLRRDDRPWYYSLPFVEVASIFNQVRLSNLHLMGPSYLNKVTGQSVRTVGVDTNYVQPQPLQQERIIMTWREIIAVAIEAARSSGELNSIVGNGLTEVNTLLTNSTSLDAFATNFATLGTGAGVTLTERALWRNVFPAANIRITRSIGDARVAAANDAAAAVAATAASNLAQAQQQIATLQASIATLQAQNGSLQAQLQTLQADLLWSHVMQPRPVEPTVVVTPVETVPRQPPMSLPTVPRPVARPLGRRR